MCGYNYGASLMETLQTKFISKHRTQVERVEARGENFLSVMRRWDKDQSGLISWHEFEVGALPLDLGRTEELELAWNFMDTDHLGRIDTHQLQKFIKDSAAFIPEQDEGSIQVQARRICKDQRFEWAICVAIVLNCVTMSLEDPLCSPADCNFFCHEWKVSSEYWAGHECNNTLEGTLHLCELLFLLFFSAEMAVRITAQQMLYFGNGWNLMDFLIVVSGWVMLTLPMVPSLTLLRLLKVLRPLKTLRRQKKLRILLYTSMACIVELRNVLGIILIFCFVFGVAGMELFMGALRNQCFFLTDADSPSFLYAQNVTDEFAYLHSQEPWRFSLPSECPHVNSPRCNQYTNELRVLLNQTQQDNDVGSYNRLCGGQRTCPVVGGYRTYCSAVMPGTTTFNPLPAQGWTPNFDNILYSWITIFQCITLEGWTDIMYLFEDSAGSARSRIFFTVLIITGSYFLLSVLLAVITDCYGRAIDQDRSIDEGAVKTIMEDLEGLNKSLKVGADWVVKSFKVYNGKEPKNVTSYKNVKHAHKSISHSLAVDARVFHAIHGEGTVIADKKAAYCIENATGDWLWSWKRWTVRFDCGEMHTYSDQSMHAKILVMPTSAFGTRLFQIVCDKKFNTFILSMILLNTIILGSVYHDQEYWEADYKGLLAEKCSDHISRIEMQLNQTVNEWPMQTLWSERETLRFTAGVESSCADFVKDHRESYELVVGRPLWLYNVQRVFSVIFSIIFLIEVVLKLSVFGVSQFFRKTSNVLDFFLVVSSIIGLILTWKARSEVSLITVFRSMRLFRVLTMLTAQYPSIQRVLSCLQQSATTLLPLCTLLCLFIFVFALLGMQLFGATISSASRSNFAFLLPNEKGYGSLLTMFQILTGENWNDLMYRAICDEDTKKYFECTKLRQLGAVIFFLAVMCVGMYFVLNLFIAALTDSFRFSEQEDDDEEEIGVFEQGLSPRGTLQVQTMSIASSLKSMGSFARKLQQKPKNSPIRSASSATISMHDHLKAKKDANLAEAIQARQKEQQNYSKRGKALGLVPVSNVLRRGAHRIAKHPIFGAVVVIAIIVASISLIVQDPELIEQPAWVSILDAIVLAIFVLEMVVKIIDLGFVAAPYCYLRNPANILDFVIVVIGLIDMIAQSSSRFRMVLAPLRAIRVVRPLRLIAHSEGMRLAVTCIVRSIPSMIHVSIVCFLVMAIFSIMGCTLFHGRFFSCRAHDDWDTEQLSIVETSPAFVTNRTVNDFLDCVGGAGGYWVRPYYHFDNTFSAIGTLFQSATFESWLRPFDSALDARYPGEMPRPFSDTVAAPIFFVVCLTVSGHFIINVFTALMVDHYRRLKGNFESITPKQAIWIDTMYYALANTPEPSKKAGDGMWRRPLFRIVNDRYFDIGSSCIIASNILVLLTRHIRQIESWTDLQDNLSSVFAVLYSVEFLVRICALGESQYFRSRSNLIEFMTLLLTWFTTVNFTYVLPQSDAGTYIGSWLRAVRVLLLSWRMLSLHKNASGTQLILGAIAGSLPAILNIGGLLLLLLTVYGVLGKFLFWNVQYGQYISKHANFRDFSSAIVTLIRVLTGENWPGLKADVRRDNCALELEDTYIGCGGTFLSGAYFYSFLIFGSFTLLNLFIAVVLEQIETVQRMKINPLRPQAFVTAWSEFDPDGTMLIPYDKLEQFMIRLGPPMGFPKAAHKRQRVHVLLQIRIPCHLGALLSYVDVLEHLSRFALNVQELPDV